MISIDEAEIIIRENHLPEQEENLPVEECTGRILAKDITSPEPSPRFTNSAMDGFAVKWQDVKKAKKNQPVTLEIIGEVQAGIPVRETVQKRQTVHISTGAMVPAGTDTIIPVESAETIEHTLRVLEVEKKDQHVRFEGEEFIPGDLLLKQGTTLNPTQIALLASVGVKTIPVFKKPKVSIITTGTELMHHTKPIKPWQIRDSNTLFLTSAVKNSGGLITMSKSVADNPAVISKYLQKASKISQIILLSGGVSVGRHDYVKEAANRAGFEILFWKIRQKPGKPFFFARKRNCLLFGFPGNPGAVVICYAYYIHPFLQRLQGKNEVLKKIKGKLIEPLSNLGSRSKFIRIKLINFGSSLPEVQILGKQNSYMLTSSAYADGYILLEENKMITKNSTIDVYLFPWRD
jgi:molybdopterin molybdotransferase